MPDLTREEAIDLLRGGSSGVAQWNARRGEVPSRGGLAPPAMPEVDLSGANLSECDLRNAFLVRAFLTGANLEGANLAGAALSGAFLNGANFSRANLCGSSIGSSSLVETQFIGANLRTAHLNQSICIRTVFENADLSGANLHATVFAQVDFRGSVLDGATVYGSSVWDVNLERASQKDIVITLPEQPLVTVDNLEIAQFVGLIMRNQRIRDVIDSIASKLVLILGRFSTERKPVLDGIRQELRQRNYCPVLFDFERPMTRDTQETVTILAGLSHFVIGDLSMPRSIPQELAAIVATLRSVPIQPIIQTGEEPWGMFDSIRRHRCVLPLHEYEGLDGLLRDLGDKVIEPAEAKTRELRDS